MPQSLTGRMPVPLLAHPLRELSVDSSQFTAAGIRPRIPPALVRMSKLGSFCVMTLSGGIGSHADPRPLPSRSKLASFFRAPLPTQSTITLFLQSACLSWRPGRNWLRFARLSPAATLAAQARRSIRGKLAFFCAIALTGSHAAPRPVPSGRKLALFFRGRAPVQFTITLFRQTVCLS